MKPLRLYAATPEPFKRKGTTLDMRLINPQPDASKIQAQLDEGKLMAWRAGLGTLEGVHEFEVCPRSAGLVC